eukprot:14794133-Heterocapsa_arctica.AAC.1
MACASSVAAAKNLKFAYMDRPRRVLQARRRTSSPRSGERQKLRRTSRKACCSQQWSRQRRFRD